MKSILSTAWMIYSKKLNLLFLHFLSKQFNYVHEMYTSLFSTIIVNFMNKERMISSSLFDVLSVQKYKLNELTKMNTYVNLLYTEKVNGMFMSLLFNKCDLSLEDKKDKEL